jgi:hypothetical protein
LTAAGIYTRTVPGFNGCDSVITLTLAVLPNSQDSIAASVCQGQSYTFGSQNLNVPGIYTRSLLAANGCDSVIILTLSVLPHSSSSITDSICSGDVYTFGGQLLSSSGIYTRIIQAANGCDSLITLSLSVLSNSSSSLQAVICQGTYYVFGGDTLRNPGFYNDTLVSLNGCDSVVLLQLNVNSAPQASITALGSTVLCQGDSVTLSANPGTTLIYSWRLNGTIISSATSSTYNATTAGSYRVLVTDTNGCSTLSNSLTVQVNPRPQPVASLNGNVLSLSGGPFSNYQWYRNSFAIVGATSSTYTVDSSGVYACLVSEGGCSALSNFVTVTGVGLADLGETLWWLYPNPCRDILMIRGIVPETASLIDMRGRRFLVNITGGSVPGDAFEQSDWSIDLSTLPSGIYWVELFDGRNCFLGRRKVVRILE